MSGSGRSSSMPRIMVFRPSMEEFKDFSKYIQKIESLGAQKAGIAKIIPPEGWCPRKKGYDSINLVIPSPISQMVTGRHGLYQQYNIQKKQMTVKEFKKLAESTKYKTPPHFDYEDLERKYWKNITYNSPIYGADVSGSLYDEGIEEFNIQHLNTILDMVKEDYEIQIEGVNTAYLYFGMWKTTFAWHTEDMDLYSINYLHFGAPKSWYAIPPEHGRRLERLASNFFHGSSSSCPAFLRHKMTVISPQILKQYCIPYNKITQEPGEFMITFPFGYHSGFNHGYNCAESTNFALPRWVEYGKRAISCTCRNDCVKICMDMFIRKFQPDRYEMWKIGKDFGAHPEDPSRHYPAPAPKKLELALAARREENKKAKASNSQKIKRHPISKMGKISEEYKGECVSRDDNDDSDTKETEIYDIQEGIDNKEDKSYHSSDTEECDDEEEQMIPAPDSPPILVDIPIPSTNVGRKKKLPEKKKGIKRKKKSNDKGSQENINLHSSFNSLLAIGESHIEKTVVSYSSDDDVIVEKEVEVSTSEPEEVLGFPKDNQIEGKSISPVASVHPKPTIGILNDDFLTKFPSLRQAINNGTFAVIQIPPMAKNVNVIGVVDSSRMQSPPQLTKISVTPHVSPVSSLSPPKISPVATEGVVHNWGGQGTWKCEQTQGLKFKFVQPKQMVVSPVKLAPVENPPTVGSLHCLTEKSTTSLSTFEKPVLKPTDTETVVICSPKVGGALKSTEFEESPIRSLTIAMGPSTVTDNNFQLSASSSFPEPTMPKLNAICSPIISPKSNLSVQGGKKKKHRRSAAMENFAVWSTPITKLWQHVPYDFEAVKMFNIHCSNLEPHCSICALFTTPDVSTHYPLPEITVPSFSKVKMPSFCFGNHLDIEYAFDMNPLYSRDGTSPLLVCSRCKVCVHATCYGITMIQMRSWLCSRCLCDSPQDVECCLCLLRGGALKPTTDGRWAHVLCTILIPDVSFDNVILKEPINVSKLSASRQRLKCKYCFKSLHSVHKKSGACIQCHSGKCYLPFHVTCGYVAGVVFEANDWPEPINIICTKHIAGRRKNLKRTLTNVKVGDKVLAKYRNKRYYWVEVGHIYTQDYYSVLFEDNSTSTNTLPEDIVWREFTKEGCPNVDEKIQVKWTDGKIYNAVFKNSRPHQIYEVQFEDDTVLALERSQIYASDETLPREVSSKISHSTERRHIFEPEANGKRVRISNQKYHSSET